MRICQFEMRGKSHVNLNIECQDFHKCLISEDCSTTIIAVADGVGSSKFAQRGAETAVNTAIEVCKKHFPIEKNPEDFKAVIRMAMIAAEKEIVACAKTEKEDPVEFATTLMIVIGVDNIFYYGFCGDGGIIAFKGGGFEKITTPQKGEDGESVITLLSGSSTMKFGIIENVDSLLVATDGVYDKLCDNRLCHNKDSGVYNNLCCALMDITSVDNPEKMYADAFSGETDALYNNLFRCIERNVGTENSFFEQIKENAYFDKLLNAIHDDITLVVISCKANFEKTPSDIYEETDLQEFLMNLNKQLYPCIISKFKKEDSEKAGFDFAEADNPEYDDVDIVNPDSENEEKLQNAKKAKKQNKKIKRKKFFLALLAIAFFKHRRKNKRRGV